MKNKKRGFLFYITHTIIWGIIVYLYLTHDKTSDPNSVFIWMTKSIVLCFLIILMYSKSTILNKNALEFEYSNTKKPDLIHIFLIVGAGFFFNMLINNLYTVFFGSEILPNDKLIMNNIGLYIPFYISVCLLAPIIEEIIFRGYFYMLINNLVADIAEKYAWPRFIRNEYRIKIISYVIISSSVFAILHKQSDFFTFLTYALFGVILSVIFLITKRIWPGMIFHALNNTYAVLSLVYVKDDVSFGLMNIILISLATAIFPLVAVFYPNIKKELLKIDNH